MQINERISTNVESNNDLDMIINNNQRRASNSFPQANGLIEFYASDLNNYPPSPSDQIIPSSLNSTASNSPNLANTTTTNLIDKKSRVPLLHIDSSKCNPVSEFKKEINLGSSNLLNKYPKKLKLGWSKLYCQGEIPTERSGHTSFLYKGNLYVFGGYGHNIWYNDMYILDMNCLVWKELNKKNQRRPCKRLAHTMVVVGNKAYMFGGWEENDQQLNDLWSYDIDSDSWEEIIPAEGSEVPSARFRHVCAVYETGKKLFIFGGYDWVRHIMMNDIYEYNIETNLWKKVFYFGSICGRERHACVVDEKKHLMYIFGGYNGKKFLNELHTFDFDTYEIKQVSKCFGSTPKGVRSHSFVSISNSKSAILFAGRDERDNDNNELFELNLDTMKWNEIVSEGGETPHVRGRHTAVITVEGKLIIFGGTHSRFWYNDTYVYHFGTYHKDISNLFLN